MKYDVFISYSHNDKELIAPVVSLIRFMRTDLVFQDFQDLTMGRWEPQLLQALDDAKLVIVFWCQHSAQSTYVRKEYERAIKSKKDILPVVLDFYELDPALAKYQWVDFRGKVIHDYYGKNMAVAARRDRKNKSSFLKILISCLVLIVIVFGIKYFYGRIGQKVFLANPSGQNLLSIILIILFSIPIIVILVLLAMHLYETKIGYKKSDAFTRIAKKEEYNSKDKIAESLRNFDRHANYYPGHFKREYNNPKDMAEVILEIINKKLAPNPPTQTE